MSKPKRPTVRDCIGCRNNFYNHARMGLNESTGRPECWSLPTAVFVKAKDVPIDMPPPYTHLPLTTRPNCYQQRGYSRVTPDALDTKGYWKS